MKKEYLTVKELADLKGCKDRHARRLITCGKVCAIQKSSEKNGQTEYRIPVDTLPEDLKAVYYRQFAAASTKPKEAKIKTALPYKSLEELTVAEREEYAFWVKTVEKWMSFRIMFNGPKETADSIFVNQMSDAPYRVSRDILYRKESLLSEGNPNAVIDHRGGYNRGHSDVPQEVWDWFLSQYLDQRRLALVQVYQAAKAWCKTYHEDLVDLIPSESAFRRKIKQVPEPLITLGRYGEKAFSDRHQPYIQRLYDDLLPNDYWIGDNHTLDIISKRDDGSDTTHRLYLTAFIDARSAVMTGWYVTENPSSQSTIYALRHAINRFGIPHNIYLDNGSEFLTHDLAGRGHRRRKSQEGQIEPPTIFAKLGINMVNAIVRNAKAKPIERTFLAFKGQISQLFETFTGGNTQERPEALKKTLKDGRVPLDHELRSMLDDLIDGIYNQGAYGGAVAKDRGKKRIEIWNKYIDHKQVASDEDLNLMLLRTSKPQKIARNGVYLTVSDEKLFYWVEDSWKLQGKLVYVRYDPLDLESVRIYEAETDKFIACWPMARDTRLKFAASVEDVKIAMKDVRGVSKDAKRNLKAIKDAVPKQTHIDILDIQLRTAQAAREGMLIVTPTKIVPIRSNEEPYERVRMASGGATMVDVSLERMNRNAEKRTGK